MCHHNDRFAEITVQACHEAEDFLGRNTVQISGRLVGHQDSGIADNGPGNGHPLLLAARKLRWIVLHAVCQSDQPKRCLHMIAPVAAGQRGQQQWQLNIFKSGQHRYQVVKLEDESDMGGTPASQLRLTQGGDVHIINHDRTTIGRIDARNQIKQCTLAGTGRPHQCQELTSLYVETDVFQNRNHLSAPQV